MPKIFNYKAYIGKKYNSFVVLKDLGFAQFKSQLQRVFLVRCDCGVTKQMALYEISSGRIKTCGLCKPRGYKHGMAYHPLNRVYSGIKTRCYDKYSVPFKNYGGRGIKMCDEWLNDKTTFFEWAIKSGYGKGLEIDRINNDGNYEPSNCRWVTRKLQASNRRSNKHITYNGITMTLSQWDGHLGFRSGTMKARITTKGWTPHKAITTPIR